MPGSQSLPPSARLRRSSDIRAVFRRGRRSRHGPLDVFIRKSPDGSRRIGVVVPKHGRKIIERNRLKRRLREILRREGERGNRATALDVVVRARPEAYEAGFSDLVAAIDDCLAVEDPC